MSTTADVMGNRRNQLNLSQTDLGELVQVTQRQIARYESGEQAPTLPVAVRIADALGISLAELAGVVSRGLNLSGDWYAAWQTWKDGVERVDVHPLRIGQEGDFLQLDGSERARSVEEGSYSWRGELRLWDNEALMGWYRATDGAVRSKGTIYFALHPHGSHAVGSWVGLSYEGLIVRGWGAMARSEDHVRRLVAELIETQGALKSWPMTNL